MNRLAERNATLNSPIQLCLHIAREKNRREDGDQQLFQAEAARACRPPHVLKFFPALRLHKLTAAHRIHLELYESRLNGF